MGLFSTVRGLFRKRGDDRTAAPSRRLPVPGQQFRDSTGSGAGLDLWSQITWGRLNGDRSPDFLLAVGDIEDNSAVAACINWIATNWTQAVPVVYAPTGDNGELEPMNPPHPLLALLRNPSPYFSARTFWRSVLRDYYSSGGRGNAYAFIVTSAANTPVELQYLPSRTVLPVGSAKEQVSGYQYKPDGRVLPNIEARYVMHFRNGMDQYNIRKGIDPLGAVLPEVATDNAATTGQYNLLENGAVPPWIVGPSGTDGGVVATITPEDAKFVKEQIKDLINRREGLVMPAGFKIERLAFSPKDLVLGETQRKSEERIAAQFGLPPVVVGLGAGLDRSTFNNYEEARQAAWEDCIIPLQDDWADEIGRKLLPLFGDATGLVFGWDRKAIRCLQDDETAHANDAALLFSKGVIDRASAKRRIGEQPEEGDDGLYVGSVSAAIVDDPPGTVPGQDDPPKPKPRAQKPKAATKKATASGTTLSAALADFRAKLRAGEDSAVAALGDALGAVEVEVRGALDDLLDDMQIAAADGETISPGWIEREKRYVELLRQIETRYADLPTAPIREAQRRTITEAQQGAQTLTRASAGTVPATLTAGEAAIALRWNHVPMHTLEAAVGFASDGSPLADLFASLGEDTGKAVRDALFAGIGAGYNSRKTARLMRHSVDAKLAISRNRAETIAATETMRAARESARQSFRANAAVLDGWTWVAAGDSRTCAACWAMDGTLHKDEETLDGHQRCRCVPVPRTKSWAELTGDDSIPDTRPVIETGEEKFARLPGTVQAEILGDRLHELYTAGTVTLADCVQTSHDPRWGSMRSAATIDQAQANAARRAGN